jgi:predicted phage terminase large subunit-like protein
LSCGHLNADHPEREPLEVLEEQQRLLGRRFFSAQYLQAPVPLEGGIVKRVWLRTYQPFEVMAPERVVASWDTASKMGELNDYTVGTIWAIKKRRVYLLDVVRERLELPALKRRVIEEADRWQAERVLIEDKGSGTGLLQELRVSGFHKARPYMPKGDKGLRLASVTPIIEEGRVYLQHRLAVQSEHPRCLSPDVAFDSHERRHKLPRQSSSAASKGTSPITTGRVLLRPQRVDHRPDLSRLLQGRIGFLPDPRPSQVPWEKKALGGHLELGTRAHVGSGRPRHRVF